MASRIHAFNALARPSAIPSAYRPRPSKASLFRRLPSALLTAIKSASFPMALLHGFLDRHPLRRKHRYYTKISAECGRPLKKASIPNDASAAASQRPTHHLRCCFHAVALQKPRFEASRPLTPDRSGACRDRIEEDVPVLPAQRFMRRTYLRGIEANSVVMPISWNARKRSSTHSNCAIFLHLSDSFGTTQALKICHRLFASCMSR